MNPNQRELQLRQQEKHYRETGYSHGYAGLAARSRNAWYQQGWRAGRKARRDFDESAAHALARLRVVK